MSGSDDPIQRLNDLSNSDGTVGSSFTKGIALLISAFFLAVTDTLRAMFNLIIVPLGEFADGLAGVVGALLGGSGDIIQAGAIESATGLEGYGVLGFTAGVVIVLGTAYVVALWAQREPTSDSFLPFTMTDLPGPFGADEDEQ